jgi:peptide-methionine (S)-S-oxide reductase
MSKATFAGGCFWCTEAVFRRVDGVKSVVSGYTGGELESPTYEQISSGRSGHAEAIEIEFDESKVSYRDLLRIFMLTHDPTTLNRQGADHGTQYRSAIFYHDETQKQTVQDVIEQLHNTSATAPKTEANGESPAEPIKWQDWWEGEMIVTEIVPASNFYPAEDYHQNYYELNKSRNPYCRVVIDPKLKKLEAIIGSGKVA